MGLEFETGVKVTNAGGEELAYDDPIRNQINGWEIKADSSCMEFVTTPLDSRGEVDKVMGDMTKYARAVQAKVISANNFSLGQLPEITQERKKYNVSYEGKVAAKPQVTFGVPIEKIADFLDLSEQHQVQTYNKKRPVLAAGARLGSGNYIFEDNWLGGNVVRLSESQADTGKGIVDAYKLARVFYRDVLNGLQQPVRPETREKAKKLEGFVALVVRYLNDFWANQLNSQQYSKASVGVLSRTDFHSIYQNIDSVLKNEFSKDRLAKAWGFKDESDLEKYQTHPGGFEIEKMDADAPEKSKDIERYHNISSGKSGFFLHKGYSYSDWIDSVIDPKLISFGKALKKEVLAFDAKNKENYETRGQSAPDFSKKDLMSRGGVAYSSQSMGAMGLDTVDSKKSALLEFRELARAPALDYDDWHGFATEMYRFYLQAKA